MFVYTRFAPPPSPQSSCGFGEAAVGIQVQANAGPSPSRSGEGERPEAGTTEERRTGKTRVDVVDTHLTWRAASFCCDGVFYYNKAAQAGAAIEDRKERERQQQEEVYRVTCAAHIAGGSSPPAPLPACLVYTCYGQTGSGKTYTLFGCDDGAGGGRDEQHEEEAAEGQSGRSRTGPRRAFHRYQLCHSEGGAPWHPHSPRSWCALDAGWRLAHTEWWEAGMRGGGSGVIPRFLTDLAGAPGAGDGSPHTTVCVAVTGVEHGTDGLVDIFSRALQEETNRVWRQSVDGGGVEGVEGRREVLLLMQDAFRRHQVWVKGEPEGAMTDLTAYQQRWCAGLQRQQQEKAFYPAASPPFAWNSDRTRTTRTLSAEQEEEEERLRCLAFYQPSHYKSTAATPHIWQRLKGLLFTSPATCWCVLQKVLELYRHTRPTPSNPSGSSRAHLLLRIQQVCITREDEQGSGRNRSSASPPLRPSDPRRHYRIECTREALFVDLAGAERLHGEEDWAALRFSQQRSTRESEEEACEFPLSHHSRASSAVTRRHRTPPPLPPGATHLRQRSRRARSVMPSTRRGGGGVGEEALEAAASPRETQHINTSLLALRRVFRVWAAHSRLEEAATATDNEGGGKRFPFIPFKENSLTSILEPFLSLPSRHHTQQQRGRVVLVVCCSSAARHFPETVVSLRCGADAATLKSLKTSAAPPPPLWEPHRAAASLSRSASRSPSPAATGGGSAVLGGRGSPRQDAHRCRSGSGASGSSSGDEAMVPDDILAAANSPESAVRVISVLYQQCLSLTQRYRDSVEDVRRATALLVEKEAEVEELKQRLQEVEGQGDGGGRGDEGEEKQD